MAIDSSHAMRLAPGPDSISRIPPGTSPAPVSETSRDRSGSRRENRRKKRKDRSERRKDRDDENPKGGKLDILA
jgi:hypothetical protein